MPKIMIVDDDRTTVKLLQTLLELDGFEVSAAFRGQDVMPLANKHHPDLFVIDFHLVDMDGIEVIKALRQHPQFARKPIIMASGMNVEAEAMAAGASMFLVKPFEPGDLPAIFQQLMNP